jgi:hypothetical protein
MRNWQDQGTAAATRRRYKHEACEAGQTVPIKVARRTIGDPLAAVIAPEGALGHDAEAA